MYPPGKHIDIGRLLSFASLIEGQEIAFYDVIKEMADDLNDVLDGYIVYLSHFDTRDYLVFVRKENSK